MKRLFTACALLVATASATSAQENVDSLNQRIDSLENALSRMTEKEQAREHTEHINKVWKQKKIFNIGFMDQTLKNVDIDEELESKSAFFLQIGKTMSLHKKPIANVLKIGLDWVTDISYANYEKIDEEYIEEELGDDYIEDGDYDEDEGGGGYLGDLLGMELGRHQLSVGIGIGPSINYAPFANKRSGIAHLKVNTYFRFTPSYSAIIFINDDETEFNNAFCLYKNWGIGLQWKALFAGFETRWGEAKYKMTDFGDDMLEDAGTLGGINSIFSSSEKIKFKTTSSRLYIGFRF